MPYGRKILSHHPSKTFAIMKNSGMIFWALEISWELSHSLVLVPNFFKITATEIDTFISYKLPFLAKAPKVLACYSG